MPLFDVGVPGAGILEPERRLPTVIEEEVERVRILGEPHLWRRDPREEGQRQTIVLPRQRLPSSARGTASIVASDCPLDVADRASTRTHPAESRDRFQQCGGPEMLGIWTRQARTMETAVARMTHNQKNVPAGAGRRWGNGIPLRRADSIRRSAPCRSTSHSQRASSSAGIASSQRQPGLVGRAGKIWRRGERGRITPSNSPLAHAVLAGALVPSRLTFVGAHRHVHLELRDVGLGGDRRAGTVAPPGRSPSAFAAWERA